VILGRKSTTGVTNPLTEEQTGGTTPEPGAVATADQAPEDTVAAAAADEPATTVDAPTASSAETTADSSTDAVSAATTEPAAAEASTDDASSAGSVAAEAATAEPDTTDAGAARNGLDTPAVTDRGAGDSLSADETADAPAASDDDEEPAPAPARDLGPEPTTMEELLAEQDSDIKSFKHGDVVEGQVVRIDKDEILVDIGAKSEGVVSNRELFGRHGEGQPALNIGDTVLVYVLQPESPEGHVVLSLRRAGLERKWRSMQEQFEAGVIIEAPVIDHNKGGLIVDCGIRGFVPISQIVDFPRRPQNDQPRDAAQEIAEKLQPFVGRKLRLKILEVNRKANRLILSEKVALYEERREKRDELFSSLQVGQKVTGTVRSIAPFGVFIDLGGIDGLVHKSELSWNKVNNPEAGYRVGEEVEAEVIDINHERGRISLSIRRLQPDPWHSTVADFNVGDVIDGTVTKLVNFGAFVRVRDGLEGLIHISELSHQRVAHPGDVVHEGQQLKLKIISLDSERHRLGLSLKQAEEPPARPAPEAAPTGQAAAAGPSSAPAGPRPERRPRPERSYSMSDAVQEPEGGIDNTLASAFAQVRQQLAAAEGEDVEAPTAEAEAEAPEAEAPEAVVAAEPEAEAPTAEAEAPEAVAEAPTAEAPAAEAVVEAPEAEAPEAVAEAPATEAAAAEAEAEAPEAVVAAEALEAEPPAAEAAEVAASDEVAQAPDGVAESAEAEGPSETPEAVTETPGEAEEAPARGKARAAAPAEAEADAAAEAAAPTTADVETQAEATAAAEDADEVPAAEPPATEAAEPAEAEASAAEPAPAAEPEPAEAKTKA
jgi:small subunit ribosomal protein S1